MEERISENTEHDSATGCLLWTGATSSGYAAITKPGGGMQLGHRYVWEQAYGPIPAGIDIDHSCHRRNCIALPHLREATAAQNGANRSGPNRNGSTGVRNVHRHNDRFRVRVMKDGKAVSGGVFSSLEEAAAVADQLRAELFGAFCGKGTRP